MMKADGDFITDIGQETRYKDLEKVIDDLQNEKE